MTRSALARKPTIGHVIPGRDAYLSRGQLRALVPSAPRHWTFHDMPTTVEMEHLPFHSRGQETYGKLWDRFTSHETVAAMRELLREYAELGVPRPGGYADVFHERFQSPRVPYSVNAALAPLLAGGWQAALKPGVHAGTFYKYDMRSAYLWAGSLGLPDTETYRRSTTISDKVPGVYAVELERPVPDAPFPFNRATLCLATENEVAIYSLPVKRVISGVSWKRWHEPDKMLDAVRLVSTWKQAGRSYWGRWGQRVRVACHAGPKTWTLPNLTQNIPWAHLIISRVRERLWNFSADAVHVYVDSVITRDGAIRTGEGLGDWKLEKVYRDGVIIKAPGQYGDAATWQLERMAGVAINSPLRNLQRAQIEKLAELNVDLLAG